MLIVPDLHGHFARFEAALAAAGPAPITFLGDLLDDSPRRRTARGDHKLKEEPDDARAILQAVRELHAAGRARVVLGNHEVMAIAGVLDGHAELFEVWWQHGGRQTAAGYGWRGVGDAGALADDLRWLREHGRLWLDAGPDGQKTLLSHATRPRPTRVLSGQNRYADLLAPDLDAVVWFPLGQPNDPQAQQLYPLPEGFIRSLHGHMETPTPRILTDGAGHEAIQLDLHPRTRLLALAKLDERGGLKVLKKRVKN